MPSKNSTDETDVSARWQALIGDRNLGIRLLSALVLVPIVLVDIWFGQWWFAGLIVVGVELATREWVRMIGGDQSKRAAPFIVGAMALATLGFAFLLVPNDLVPAPDRAKALQIDVTYMLIIVLAVCAMTLALGIVAEVKQRVPMALGVPYLLLPAIALIWMREQPEGLRLIIYLMFVVWATDTGAYLVGRIIGGPKLAPNISPKKTWSGAIGGTIIAGLVGLMIGSYFGTELPVVAFSLALFLAIISQFGDLLESGVKRNFAVKDSGGFIPGHGGILDRVDGLLAASVGLALFHGLLLALGYVWW